MSTCKVSISILFLANEICCRWPRAQVYATVSLRVSDDFLYLTKECISPEYCEYPESYLFPLLFVLFCAKLRPIPLVMSVKSERVPISASVNGRI